MRAFSVLLGAALLVAGTGIVAAEPLTAGSRTTVPEPRDLWPGPMHAFTPATLKGATVIDQERLATLIADKHPILIDVANLQPKPAGAPTDRLWSPIHRSIPGATWLPGGGNGTKDRAYSEAFDSQIESMTGGDRDKPIVAFCHPNRWGSWNAAKRLTMLGYKHVYWFPDGAEGWTDHHEPAPITEDASWKAKGLDMDPMLYKPKREDAAR